MAVDAYPSVTFVWSFDGRTRELALWGWIHTCSSLLNYWYSLKLNTLQQRQFSYLAWVMQHWVIKSWVSEAAGSFSREHLGWAPYGSIWLSIVASQVCHWTLLDRKVYVRVFCSCATNSLWWILVCSWIVWFWFLSCPSFLIHGLLLVCLSVLTSSVGPFYWHCPTASDSPQKPLPMAQPDKWGKH